MEVLNSPKEDISASEMLLWENNNPSIQNVLVIGLDKFEHTETANAYVNNQQADFLVLLSLNTQRKTCTAIPINRDTVTDITRLGVFGDEVETVQGQIALAHTYGSGGSDSAINTVKAVSNLFHAMPIDHYITFTMDAVPVINDLVGGVTVTIEDVFPDEYIRLKRGTTVTLQGEDALAYVRGRKAVGDQTNLNRMIRQKNYLENLFHVVKEKANKSPNFMDSVFSSLGSSIQSDFSISQMQAFTAQITEVSDILFLDIAGRTRKGEDAMEFFPDSESIEKCIHIINTP